MTRTASYLLISVCLGLSAGQRNFPNRGPQGVSQIISWLSKHSDRRVRPGADADELVVVKVNLLVTNLRALAEEDMSFSFDAVIHMRWNDSRLKYPEGPSQISLPSDEGRRLMWVPDLYVANSQRMEVHAGFTPDASFTLTRSGDVTLSYRSALTVDCNMDLRHFPLDIQVCHIYIRTYLLNAEAVQLQWEETSGLALHPAATMPAFHLLHVNHGSDLDTTTGGNYTRLFAEFKVKRIAAHYVIMTYIPSTLLVLFAGLIFHLPFSAAVERIGLAAALLLAMTILLVSSQYASPQVGYLKAIDVWVMSCFGFISLVLLSLCVLHMLAQRSLRVPSLEQFELMKTDDPAGFVTGSAGTPGVSSASSTSGTTLNQCSATGRLTLACKLLFPICFILFSAMYWITLAF